MKTPLFVLGTALAATLCAETTYISGTGFEDLTTGKINLTVQTEDDASPWGPTGTDFSEFAEIKEYAEGETAPTAVPVPSGSARYRTNDANTKYLDLDSGTTRLERATVANLENATDGVYLDTMVQFTAMDAEQSPTPDEGDKLLVWLKNETVNEVETKKLVVTAAAALGDTTRTDYVIDSLQSGIVEGTWYRLTIVATTAEYLGTKAAFKVYLDGAQVFSGVNSMFYSMVQSGTDALTLANVGFAGKGSIDDFVFGSGDPFYVAPTTFAYTINYGPNVTGFTYAWTVGGEDSEGVVVSGLAAAGSQVVQVPNDATAFKIYNVTVATGYKPIANYTDSDLNTTGDSCTLGTEFVACSIGETTYPTVAAALAAIGEDPVTIKLEANVTEAITFSAGTVTLDLNGKTITDLGQTIAVEGGALTIVNTGADTAAISSEGTAIVMGAEGGEGTVTMGADGTNVFTVEGEIEVVAGTFSVKAGKYSDLPLDGDGDELDFSAYCPAGQELVLVGGYYVLQSAGGGTSADDGSGNTFTVPSTVATPTGKTLADATGSGTTYAQAYALGLWDGTAEGTVDALPAATITVENGTVTVTFTGLTPEAAYTVKTYLQTKASLNGNWPATVDAEGSTEMTEGVGTDTIGTADSKFYRVVVTITNK